MSGKTEGVDTLLNVFTKYVEESRDIVGIVKLASHIISFTNGGQVDYADHSDRLRYLGQSASIIGAILEKADAPAEVVEAWEKLGDALADLEGGRSPAFLAPGATRPRKGSGISSRKAVQMAFGAAAIELTPRGQKEKTRRAAARRLGVTADRLGDFHKNLKGGKIKDQTALSAYEAVINGAIHPGPHGAIYGGNVPADADSWIEALKKIA